MTSLVLLVACGPDRIDVGGPDRAAGDTDPEELETLLDAADDGVEEGEPEDIFRDDVVHELAITLSDRAWDALLATPRDYVGAELGYAGQTWPVGVSLKGNSSFDVLTGKPAFKVDVGWPAAGRKFYGIPSFYLHNEYWDPSGMHEFLGYTFFGRREVPAARAAFAHLTVNGEDYGLYTFLEKQNGPFLERYFEDASGSVYESGSFNRPCDLSSGPDDSPCACFEVDRVGEGDTFADLQALCTTARTVGDGWYEAVKSKVDMAVFLRGQAAEMVVSHYDNYSWNLNNFRLAHDPTADTWIWTPWSVDLAFGWYPWTDDARCGTYGVTPDEYQSGYLLQRCREHGACRADLYTAIIEAAAAWDAADMPARVDAAEALVRPFVQADDRRYYSLADFDAEVACVRSFSEGRGDAVRAWVAGP